jgi:ADP-heptose:LPS heptosyltransferase
MPRTPAPKDGQSAILVFRSAALGDYILATPALAELRRTFPAARIVLLTTQAAQKAQREKVAAYSGGEKQVPWVALTMPHLVDEVISVPNVQSLEGLRVGRAALKGRRFTRAVLLLDPAAPWMGRLKKLVMLWALLGPVPVLGWRGRGSLNGDRAALKAAQVLRHHVHGPLQFMRELQPPRVYADSDIRFDLRPTSADQEWAARWTEVNAPFGSATRWIAVAPGSIQPHKQWPIEKFKDLCVRLAAEHTSAAFVVVGGPSDAALGKQLEEAIGAQRCFIVAGQSSIGQSAALLGRVDLLVGNDGGAMHLGDAMGAKVVSIVPGLEYPDSIEPWHNRNRAVRHAVSCAPCYSFTHCPEGHNRCMVDLPLDAVAAQCGAALEEARSTR